jgi:hypothetical protein
MCYHFAVVLLFGPFIKLRFSDSTIDPYNICTQAANAIVSLLGTYSQLYSLHRTPCFATPIALASNIVLLAQAKDLKLNVQENLARGVSNLAEMSFSHKSGSRAVVILQRSTVDILSSDQAIPVDIEESIRGSRPSKFIFGTDISRVPDSGYSSTNNSIFAPFPSQILPLLVFREQLVLFGFELRISKFN